MVVQLHQVTAALYLGAGLLAGLGVALPAPRLGRAATRLLVLAAVLHGVCFSLLHTVEPTPPLTDTSMAVSFMAWIGTLAFLLLLLRVRLAGLVVLVAPASFLGVFVAALSLRTVGAASFDGSGSWPHAHVLLASAGLSLLGLAAMAGLVFLAVHHLLKTKRPLERSIPLPSLEALDRVNVASLAVGFPLLTLGVVTGMIWVHTIAGHWWSGSPHETWSLIGWAIYGVLVVVRFGSRQGARQAAASAVGAFAFLLFAVVGVELLA